MKNKNLKSSIRPFCEKCESRFGNIRFKTNDFRCRTCGHITNLEKVEEKKEE